MDAKLEHGLERRCILLVETSGPGLEHLRAALCAEGVTILGPFADVNAALALVASDAVIDAAVLGHQHGADTQGVLVEELTRRNIPVVYSSQAMDDEAAREGESERLVSTLTEQIRRRMAMPQNQILQFMEAVDRAFFLAALQPVELKAREILIHEGAAIPFVYFPLTAVISIMVAPQAARPIEVGLVGVEGLTDLALQPGDRAALRSQVIIPGVALRMSADLFAQAIWSRPGIYRLMLAYRQSLAIQFAFSALSHGTLTIDARLARWILMLQDRSESDSLPVVHNLIAEALAVRRSGVTTALHVLEGMGAIKSLRGRIILRNRTVLEDLAAASYGAPEAEYLRLMNEARHDADLAAAS